MVKKFQLPSTTKKIMTRSALAAAAANILAAAAAPIDPPEPDSSSVPNTSEETGPTEPSRPEPAVSPAKCAICLGDLANRCYTNSCIHQFCFGCLLEWSKIKPECPLCKSNFQSIYHNIRSNDDYDEYHIPTNVIPHLSIRLTTSEGFTPGPLGGTSYRRFNEHNHGLFHMMGPPSPFHDHGYSFQRLVRERERAERVQNPSSYIRILEVGPVSEPRALDFMNINSGPGRQPLDNPFYGEESDVFGSFDDNPIGPGNEPGLRGYQGRKRIYDRCQFVQPFQATLPAGTVFFPSVEYFRTHPASFSRVNAWLYREIMVLMGIHRSRTEMGYVFDVILGLLLRFDIRSREFREMVSIYFDNRTRHFQHEFYHFLLSGMRMEEYDRVARYTTPQVPFTSTTTNRSTVTHTPTPAPRERSASPVVVTISDSDSDGDSFEQLLDVGMESSSNSSESGGEPRTVSSVEMPNLRNHSASLYRRGEVSGCSESAQTTSASGRSPCSFSDTLPLPLITGSYPAIPPSTSSGRNITDLDYRAFARRLREMSQSRAAARDVDTNLFMRPQIGPQWIQDRQPPRAHSNNETGQSALSLESIDDWEHAFNSLNRLYRPLVPDPAPEPIDGHRYSTRGRRVDDTGISTRDRIPTASASRQTELERPRCPVESGSGFSVSPLPEPSIGVRIIPDNSQRRRQTLGESSTWTWPSPAFQAPAAPSGRNFPYVHRQSSHADPVTNMNPDGTPRRGYVPEVEISRPPRDTSAHRLVPKKSKGSSSHCPSTPAQTSSQVTEVDDDEIQLLGIHPIVKPPPLAVITISSDDEEAGGRKKLKVEKREMESRESAPGSSKSGNDYMKWIRDVELGLDVEIESVNISDSEVIVVEENGRTSTTDFGVSPVSKSSRNVSQDTEKPSTSKGVQKRKKSKSKRKHSSSRTYSIGKKKIRFTTPEFVDSTTDSEPSVPLSYFQAIGKKRKRKEKKQRSPREDVPTSSCKGSHRHRSHGKEKGKEESNSLKSLGEISASFYNILNEGLPKKKVKVPATQTTANQNNNPLSELTIADSRATDEHPTASTTTIKTDARKQELLGSLIRVADFDETSSSESTAVLENLPIGILDLRKLIEAKRREMGGYSSASTKNTKSIFTPMPLKYGKRWESETEEEKEEDEHQVQSEESQSEEEETFVPPSMSIEGVVASSANESEESDNGSNRTSSAFNSAHVDEDGESTEPSSSKTEVTFSQSTAAPAKSVSINPYFLGRTQPGRSRESSTTEAFPTYTSSGSFLDFEFTEAMGDVPPWHGPTLNDIGEFGLGVIDPPGEGLDLTIGSLHPPVAPHYEANLSSTQRTNGGDGNGYWLEDNNDWF